MGPQPTTPEHPWELPTFSTSKRSIFSGAGGPSAGRHSGEEHDGCPEEKQQAAEEEEDEAAESGGNRTFTLESC